METITARGTFHAAHRQLGVGGACAWVHGHTFRGTFTVRSTRFPRVEGVDLSVDFRSLKDIFKSLDHRMMVSDRDELFLNQEYFDREGVVVLPGRNPSVENLALYCMDEAVSVLSGLFPGRGIEYDMEVLLQETDNNLFTLSRSVTI